MTLYIGGPIWSYREWLGELYPPDTRPAGYLREYARRLNTVEGNTTFYGVPKPETVARWASETPDYFRFCPKVPRDVSHSGALPDQVDAARHFIEVMSGLGDRLGPIFLQLPPHFGPDGLEQLSIFLRSWPADVTLAVEVRHLGWFGGEPKARLADLLARHRAARVIFDTRPIRDLSGDPRLQGSVYESLLQARQRKPNMPLSDPDGPFAFVRYVGHPQLAKNDAFIAAWAASISTWVKADKDVYFFCHCPDEGQDPALCRRFHEALATHVDIPPLPWDLPGRDFLRQGTLF
jgi:uncharacterized protein YecE (DUF72 family)